MNTAQENIHNTLLQALEDNGPAAVDAITAALREGQVYITYDDDEVLEEGGRLAVWEPRHPAPNTSQELMLSSVRLLTLMGGSQDCYYEQPSIDVSQEERILTGGDHPGDNDYDSQEEGTSNEDDYSSAQEERVLTGSGGDSTPVVEDQHPASQLILNTQHPLMRQPLDPCSPPVFRRLLRRLP